MEVKLENNELQIKEIQVGDIVWCKHEFHPQIIIKQGLINQSDIAERLNEKLIGVNLDGRTWLSDPFSAVRLSAAQLFKKEDWELVLRKKIKDIV